MKVDEDLDHGALDDREQHHRVRPQGRWGQEEAGQHHLESLRSRLDGLDGSYGQAREFGADGKPVKDIDFTDHGRADHPNPHQHKYLENETGGTPKRGPTEPLEVPE